ncbi:MAG TPA: glycosyltransferase, partial [Casimicrobiaceae bacterium]|nr:glycosyltransferase [Casimicrobiaceae bacterium]
MRIVVDLQGAQTSVSRHRGVGRYSLGFAKSLARRAGPHEVWIALNATFPETVETARAAFDGLVPQERLLVWQTPTPVADATPGNRWRREIGECVREAFLAELKPDLVHVSSLFEGFADDAVTSIGAFDRILPTATTLYDLIPLLHRDRYLADPAREAWYERKLTHLRRADLVLAISESSRSEGIACLNLPAERVVNVSAAADPQFRPAAPTRDQQTALRRRYALSRPFVMYTGGIDQRKNVEGLIGAYARLPDAVRGKHQLAVVCAASRDESA